MRAHMKFLAALAVWLALPLASLAANGDSCKFVSPGSVIAGTTLGSNIPLPSASSGLAATQSAPLIDCRLICDVTSAGNFSCGPMWVPCGGSNIEKATIRVLASILTATDGCSYDSVNVYTLSNTATTGMAELPSIGVLDKDAPTGGTVKQIDVFGPVGPYLFLQGTATSLGTGCDPTHRLQIQLLTYPKHPMQ